MGYFICILTNLPGSALTNDETKDSGHLPNFPRVLRSISGLTPKPILQPVCDC